MAKIGKFNKKLCAFFTGLDKGFSAQVLLAGFFNETCFFFKNIKQFSVNLISYKTERNPIQAAKAE
jgi:hypothetical protein